MTTEERLAALEKKLDKVYVSSEKTRKYILGMVIGNILVFVVPLIGLAFVIPMYLNTLKVYASL